METIRLDKFLTQTLHKTRSEVKRELKKGTVLVNGEAENRPERKVNPETDQISWLGTSYGADEKMICQHERPLQSAKMGQLLTWSKHIWIMFCKPAGCVTAREDARERTVMDYIDHLRSGELFPVGRLDKDTEGLLFLTNDGALSHRMLSPRHHVEKTYEVQVSGRLTEDDVTAFAEGIDIGDDKMTRPALLRVISCVGSRQDAFPLDAPGQETQSYTEFETERTILAGDVPSYTCAEITIYEGRFHQVKRMFAARGCEVIHLKRIRMAGLPLDETLHPGEWRELTDEEMEGLYTYVESDRRSDF
ncbi:MAG: rRNA pseudouridine synthase [Lachnospiraceae bacterium]|nr:rRNA pseudouridine synthase [Lachnospiraceae bacterium]